MSKFPYSLRIDNSTLREAGAYAAYVDSVVGSALGSGWRLVLPVDYDEFAEGGVEAWLDAALDVPLADARAYARYIDAFLRSEVAPSGEACPIPACSFAEFISNGVLVGRFYRDRDK
jgi:hypothetical protein